MRPCASRTNGNRQIARAAGDSVWTKRQTVAIDVLDRQHLAGCRHRVHTTVRIGVRESRRAVIDVERQETDNAARAGPDQQAATVGRQFAEDARFGRVESVG